MDCTSPVFGQFPCGKCINCRARYRQEWVFRLREEYKACNFGLFVTLTYDDDKLPPDGVSIEDVQKFMKRFRKRLCTKFKDQKYSDMCRYYIVSEYGDHTFRPHYHGLLFFRFDRTPDIYDIIEQSWQNGFCQFGEIEEGSIVYCTKYCLKGSDVPPGKNPNFRLLSKMSGGIGINYLRINGDFHFGKLDKPQIVSSQSNTSPMPRYYRTKLLSRLDDLDKEQIKLLYQEQCEALRKKRETKMLQKFRAERPGVDPDEIKGLRLTNYQAWYFERLERKEEAIKNRSKKQNLL